MVMSLPVISSDKMSKPKIESAREKQRPVIMTCVEFRSKCPTKVKFQSYVKIVIRIVKSYEHLINFPSLWNQAG